MAETIKIITGKKEVILDVFTKKIGHTSEELSVTSFSGGAEIGPSIQLTTSNSHVQLDKNSVTELRDALDQWLKDK